MYIGWASHFAISFLKIWIAQVRCALIQCPQRLQLPACLGGCRPQTPVLSLFPAYKSQVVVSVMFPSDELVVKSAVVPTLSLGRGGLMPRPTQTQLPHTRCAGDLVKTQRSASKMLSSEISLASGVWLPIRSTESRGGLWLPTRAKESRGGLGSLSPAGQFRSAAGQERLRARRQTHLLS